MNMNMNNKLIKFEKKIYFIIKFSKKNYKLFHFFQK